MGIEYPFKYNGCTCEEGFATKITHYMQVDVLLSTCILIIYLVVTRSRPVSHPRHVVCVVQATFRYQSSCAYDKLDCAALGSIFAHP